MKLYWVWFNNDWVLAEKLEDDSFAVYNTPIKVVRVIEGPLIINTPKPGVPPKWNS